MKYAPFEPKFEEKAEPSPELRNRRQKNSARNSRGYLIPLRRSFSSGSTPDSDAHMRDPLFLSIESFPTDIAAHNLPRQINIVKERSDSAADLPGTLKRIQSFSRSWAYGPPPRTIRANNALITLKFLEGVKGKVAEKTRCVLCREISSFNKKRLQILNLCTAEPEI